MSHLVAQHMTDQDLEIQIKAVLSALKPTGIFAIQFASHNVEVENKYSISFLTKSGGVCRSLDKIKRLFQASHAKVVKIVEKGIFPGNNSRWYTAHLMQEDL